MKRIIVTGATGFIGSSLVDKLVENGNDVIPLGRKLKNYSSKFIRNNLLSIDLDSEELPKLGKVDCVCILASQQPHKGNDWDTYYNINSKQIFKFLNLNIDQVIYISTTSVNLENSIPNPQNYYGLSKALAESFIRFNMNCFNQATIMRFPSVMGVNHHGGIVHDIKLWAENNENIDLYDKGEKFRNILHVDEAVSSIISAISLRNNLNNYEEFEIGSSNSIKLSQLAELMVYLLKSNSTISLLEKSSKAKDIFINNSKAISKLLFMPETVESGIKKYLKEFNYEV